MNLASSLPVCLGFLLIGAIIWSWDLSGVIKATLVPGWGVAAVVLFRFLPLTSDALGWRMLFNASSRPRVSRMLLVRWIGEAVNTALPVAQMGGHAARVALAARIGVTRSEAAATVAADFSFGVVTQIGYTMVAVLLLCRLKELPVYGLPLLSGLFVIACIFLLLRYLPHLRPFTLTARWVCALSKRRWRALLDGAAALDQQILSVWRPRKQWVQSLLWRLATRALYTAETWLALQLLGTNAGWTEALIIDGIITGVRSAAFAVPAALGVQEFGFVLVGQMLGLAPETALALALLRRLREIAIGGAGVATLLLLEKRKIADWLATTPTCELRAPVLKAVPKHMVTPAPAPQVTLSGTPQPPG